MSLAEVQPRVHPGDAPASGVGRLHEHARKRGAAAKTRAASQEQVRAVQLTRWLAEHAPARAAPASQPTAPERLAALRDRVRAKEAAAASAADIAHSVEAPTTM